MTSEETRTHTATHVVKGAVEKVLGAKWTASVHVSGHNGRLTVKFDRSPTEEEMTKIGEEANRKVSEGSDVLEFEMERAEAEAHFGDSIYDLFPVPEGVTILKIVRIPDWNVNCCDQEHVDNTGVIGRIDMGAPKFRNAKGELEVEFDLAD